MSEVNIITYSSDITDAEPPEALPAGEYLGTIQSVEVKQSTKTGNEYIQVAFFISPEQFPADFPLENAPEGVTLSYNRLSPDDNQRARYQMRKFCEAIGASTSAKLDLNTWIGLDARLETTKDTYEGVPQAQIKKVLPL